MIFTLPPEYVTLCCAELVHRFMVPFYAFPNGIAVACLGAPMGSC